MRIIQSNNAKLTKPVRLVVFTRDADCKACQSVIELSRTIKVQMSKIVLETYDMVMDKDKTEQYSIQRAPALVVQGGEGQTITFYGLAEKLILEVLLNTIEAISTSKAWLTEDLKRSLQRLGNDVMIRVFVANHCMLCKTVAEVAIGLALESDHINTAVIMADDFPELKTKYNITTLPMTVFGDGLLVDGNVSEIEFIQNIFKVEGVKPGLDKRCLSCGSVSIDIVCSNCKIRIQAEALEHKLKIEKQKQLESP